MNKKGQALVEFVIILPVMILLIFCVVDFARVIMVKSSLENVSTDAVLFYQNGKSQEEINSLLKKEDSDLNISFEIKDDYITINVSKSIKPITPGLSYIPKNIFDIKTSRVIKNE